VSGRHAYPAFVTKFEPGGVNPAPTKEASW
jgi:hypothetical protein